MNEQEKVIAERLLEIVDARVTANKFTRTQDSYEEVGRAVENYQNFLETVATRLSNEREAQDLKTLLG